MAFWGVYVKPEEPYVLKPDHDGRRLRITQAVLGEQCDDGNCTTVLRCSVGNKPPISICSLPMKRISCYQLNLEFEELEDVIFTIVGPVGVYLSGSYLNQCSSCRTSGDGPSGYIIKYFDCKPSEEAADIGGKVLVTTTEASNEESKGFMTDEAVNVEDKKLTITEEPENKKDEPMSTVEAVEMDKDKTLSAIEEDIGDSDSFTNGSFSDSIADYYDISDSFIDDGGLAVRLSSQEFPEVEVGAGKPKKRKCSTDQLKGNQPIGCDTECASKQKLQTTTTSARGADCTRGSCSDSLQKPRSAKSSSSKAGELHHTKGSGSSNRSIRNPRTCGNSESEVDEGAKFKRKYGGTKREGMKSQTKKRKQEGSSSCGIVIKDLFKGEPNGKIATRGKEVKIIYSAWIKETGKIVESNVGQAPFEFELGDEEIIKAWNIGVKGMRVGGVRRLILPPSLGSWRSDERVIPANSLLVYDIELVGVH